MRLHVVAVRANGSNAHKRVYQRHPGTAHAIKVARAAPELKPPWRKRPVNGRQDGPVMSAAKTKDETPIPPTPAPEIALKRMNSQRKGAVAAMLPAMPVTTHPKYSKRRLLMLSDMSCHRTHPARVPIKKVAEAIYNNHSWSHTRSNSETRLYPFDFHFHVSRGNAQKAAPYDSPKVVSHSESPDLVHSTRFDFRGSPPRPGNIATVVWNAATAHANPHYRSKGNAGERVKDIVLLFLPEYISNSAYESLQERFGVFGLIRTLQRCQVLRPLEAPFSCSHPWIIEVLYWRYHVQTEIVEKQ